MDLGRQAPASEEMAWSANFKMVWYVLLRLLRPELDGQDPFQIIEPCVKLEKRRL
jgi:hypothetical protein